MVDVVIVDIQVSVDDVPTSMHNPWTPPLQLPVLWTLCIIHSCPHYLGPLFKVFVYDNVTMHIHGLSLDTTTTTNCSANIHPA